MGGSAPVNRANSIKTEGLSQCISKDSIREAAHRADEATSETMGAYQDETADYEVSITGGLAVALRTALNKKIKGLSWSAHILKTGRGSAAEESQVGADLIIHVSLNTPEVKYSKGVLVQAKRVEPNSSMGKEQYDELVKQCKQMLDVSASSFVFVYTLSGMRCAPASVVAATLQIVDFMICVYGRPIDFFLNYSAAQLVIPKSRAQE